ncbi:MAG: GNAT family N-acetyltransferase [Myxococcota bacterium]|nr:GNAT family N-acetyltransferase [Myxococcota bacterium]
MLPPELTRAEILAEVVERPRHAYVPLPDLQVIERPGWMQLVTPSFRQGGFNEVAYAVLDPAEADAVIDRTVAQYRALGIKFRWTVGPDSAPPDLGDRLAARGLLKSVSCGMARATTPELPAVGDAVDVRVTEVDATTVDRYTHAMAEGWEVEPGPLAIAHAAALSPTARTHHLFLAEIAGAAAGVASYVRFPRSAYLLGGVVLPAYRRRGVYRALVGTRLAHARAQGIALATSHAREVTSAPILGALGFQTLCRLAAYSG